MDADQDAIVDEFMGGSIRAAELREMRLALRERLDALVRERDAMGADGKTPAPQIAQLRRQLAAVEQEEVVSEFVEASVRASLAQPTRPGADSSDEG